MIDLEKLVPMPEPALHDGITVNKHGRYSSTESGYTASQMTAFRQQVAQEVAKRCAEIAREKAKPVFTSSYKGLKVDHFSLTDAAYAIAAEFGLGDV